MFKKIKERFSKNKRLAKKQPEILRYEELEQRVLFSADVVPGLDIAAVEEQVIVQDVTSEVQVEREAASETVEQTAEEKRSELVFVNENVADYQQLIDDLRNSDNNQIIEVVVLESDRDGIEQISYILSERTDLAAVHFITHGSDGQINLGDTWLDSTTLQQNRFAVAGWGSALTESGDILFYGCNLAAEGDGQNLLNNIAQLTGADVSASDDPTGHTSLGGDWDLEFSTGSIDVGLAPSLAAQQDWAHQMALETVRDTFSSVSYSNNNGSVSWSGPWVETDGQGGGASGGNILVSGSCLYLQGNEVGDGIYRQANLDGAGVATLTFDMQNGLGVNDVIRLEISDNGGGSWNMLKDYSSANFGILSESFDISLYAAADTQIRFRYLVANGDDNPVLVDNIQIEFGDAPNEAPVDLQATATTNGGISLNQNGGNDAYLIADDGGAIFGGLTALTAEVRFSMDSFPNSTNFFSYATASDDNVFKFNIRDDGDLSVSINSVKINSAAMDYRTLASGQQHTLSVTWNSTGGAWEMFVDGASVDNGSGLESGVTLAGSGALVIGNDQDSVDGGYDPAAEAAATIYDARIFSDIRTSGEIAANYATTLPNSESGMVANWTFNDLSTSGVVTDTVSGNNMTVMHAVGAGFVASTPALTFQVYENTADGTVVGTMTGTDPEGDPLSYTLTDDAGGRFAIDLNSGVITVADGSLLDYENSTIHSLTVQVGDGNGGIDTQAISVTVTNVAPITLTASGMGSVVSGGLYTLNLSADEDITSWTINWGDGNIETIAGNPPSVTHIYTNAGFTNDILVSATDADGTYSPSDLIVTSRNTNTLFWFESQSGAFVQESSNLDGLNAPIDVVVGPDGNLYASTYNSHAILRYDINTGLLIDTFVTSGSGGLNGPTIMAFGADANLYVSSGVTNEILRYDGATGAFIDAFVAAGAGGLSAPGDILFGPDANLYVVNRSNNDVMRFDGTTGAFIDNFIVGTTVGIAFGPDGNLYATTNSSSVDRFNGTTGTFIDTFVASGSGGLSSSKGIQFGPDGNLYVSSTNNDSVIRYDGTSGAYIDTVVSSGSNGIDNPFRVAFKPVQQVLVSAVNAAPVITSDGGGATASVNVAENTTAVTTVTATDADGDQIEYTIAGGADAALFDIDRNTGALTFLSTPDFEAPGDTNGDNVYEVVVSADDQISTPDTQTINITVTDINEGPDQYKQINENTLVAATMDAGDQDAPPYGIIGGADASLFLVSHNPVSRTFYLMFSAPPNFESPSDSNLDNIYEVTVNFNDVIYNYFVTVKDANDAPTGLPVISGTTAEDQTLTADTSGISDEDGLGGFNYLWLRNGSCDLGRTASTYTLDDADVGAQISVEVNYTDGLGTVETVTSAQTAAITGINDAPVLSGAGMHLTTITEDTATNNGDLVSVIIASAGGDPITDADVGAVEGIAIFNLSNSNGTWEYDIGSDWTPVGSVSVNSSLLLRDTDSLRFVPNANWNGTELFSFAAWDQTSGTAGTKVDTSAYGGTTAFSSGTATPSITVNAVNDDPTNAGTLQSASVVTEDVSSTINLSAINLSDVDAGAGALTMTLTTSAGGNLTAAAGTGITIGGNGTGVLTLTGNLTDLNTYLDSVGDVTYLHSVAHTSGFAADTIQVDITDNGNTGSGGGGTNSLGTFNVDITAVNDAPVVTTTGGATAYTEQAAATVIDAGISLVDPDGFDGVDSSDQYTAVIQITGNYEAADTLGFTDTSNIQGVLVGNSLTLSVIGGQTATVADFQAALRTVTFYNGSDTPSELNRTITFSFDDGVDSSNLSTKTIQVTAVNDTPEGTNNTVTTNEDTDYVFNAVDFGFSDPNDSPADNFANVIINTTVTNGTLYVDVDGNGLVDGAEALSDLDTVSVADITAGRLKFKPAANANGTNYDSFTFQVQDDGGGFDTDLTVNTMTINVTAVNDAAPVATDDTYSVSEDNALTADWWNTAWTRRQELTLDNAAQDETLTDFPVLIIVNASNINYDQTKDDGSDLRFFAADGTLLVHEIEQWNEGGNSSVWVRVPQITGNSNSDSIWMYYGNAAAQPITNAVNVWDSNFVGVWHLNQEQSGTGNVGVYKDSTGTGNNGIDRVAATGQDGQVTDGKEFGTSDWIEIAHDASLDLKDSMTISFWIKPTSDSGTFNRVVEKGLWGYQDSYYFGGGNGTNDLTFYLNNQEVFDTADNVLTVGDWQHCTVSYTSNGDGNGSARLYINGVEVDINGDPAGVAAPPIGTYNGGIVAGNTGRLAIGHENSSYDFDGFIDEVQISNTDRSTDWIAAQYKATRNQFDAEFVKFGGEESAPAIGGVLSNDNDVDNDSLTVTLVDGPDNAQSFTLNKDGTFTYTPTADYNGTDTFTYEVNDGNGGTTQATATIAVNPVNDGPVDLKVTSTTEGGTSINEDGGNDVYFVADNGGGLLGGLTTVTIEASFSIKTPSADNSPLLSYADGTNDEELGLFLKSDGAIWFCADSQGLPYQSTANQYPELFDGEKHHVGVSWDSSTGTVEFFIDGQQKESFTGYQTGKTITGGGELVFGQDQDSELGGFNPIDVFSGKLYDIRIFNDIRSAGEIAGSYDQTLPNTEPGMIANWTFNDMSTDGIVTDAVSGNDLTMQHVGGGFTPSTSELTLEVQENAADETIIGTITGIDPDTGDTLIYSLLDDAGGRFDIVSGTGILKVADGSLLNYEAATSHNITVQVTDAAGSPYSEVMSVTVNPVNEAPTDITLDNNTVAENSSAGTVIGNLTATDPDLPDTATFAFVSGTGDADNTKFEIVGDELRVNTLLDFETQASYSVRIEVSDSDGETYEKAFIITANDINEAPVNTVPGAQSVNEDTALAIGGISVSDVDGNLASTQISVTNGTLNVTLSGTSISAGANGSNTLTISGSQADINATLASLTYQGNANFNGSDTLTVISTDSAGTPLSDTDTVTVNVTADNDSPTIEAAIADQNLAEDFASYTIDLNAAFADVETTDANLVYGVSGNTNINVSITGGIATITPTADWNGSETLSFSATDQGALSVSQDVVFAVSAVADIAADSAVSVTEDTPTVIAVLANDSFEGSAVVTATTAPANGALVINGDNTITYTPNANYTGADSFTYTVTSGGVTETATVTVNVTADNDAPTIEAAIADQNLAEDFASYTIDLNAAFADVETTDANLVYGVSGNTNINVSITGGIATITPTADWNGSETLSFSATDQGALSVSQDVVFAVSAVADIAADSAVSVTEDTPTVIAVLANDSFEGSAVVTATTAPANGAVVINGDNTITYTPNANYTGADSFTYTVTSGGITETATVTVNVTADNDAPTIEAAIADQNLAEDFASYTIDLNAAFDDVETTDANLVYGVSGNTNINVSITAGIATITPSADWNGSETLTFSATDTGGLSVSQNVVFAVSAVADIAADSAVSVTEDTPTVIAVLANDSFEGSPVVTATTAPANGALVINGDNTITYTPNANYNGADSFTYTVTSGGVTETATVTVNVTADNDAPTIAAAIADQNLAEDFASYTIDLNAAFADVETTDANLVYGVSGNTNINVSITGGIATITPSADWNGSETLSFSATDQGALSVSQDVVFAVSAVADIAADSAVSVTEDTPTVIAVLANDSFEGSPVVTATTAPANGALVINGDNTITYTPNANYTGADSFTYTVTSGGVTETATVTVNVTADNDAPTIAAAIADQNLAEDFASYTIDLNAAFDDVETTDANLVYGVSGNTNINVSITGGIATITPSADWNGSETLSFSATDQGALSVSQDVVFAVSAVADIADDTAVSVTEDTPTVIAVLANDSFEGSPVVTATTAPANGALVINGDNTITYTPNANYTGADSFTYTVTSGGVTETATVTVNVTADNDAPTIAAAIADQNLAEDFASYTIDLNAAFADVETTDANLVYGVSGNTNINVSITAGIATITPTADWNGSETLTFSATDQGALSVSQDVVFAVSAVADIAADTAVSVTEDTPTVIAVLANDSFEGSAVVTATTAPANGAVVINGDNTITYTPNANYTGADSFTYTVTSGGVTETATVTVNVTADNDAPTIEAAIADQNLAEDFASYTIDLNAAFADVETTDANLVYGVSGNTNINVSITAGIATITPTADWNGSETLTFSATDTGALSVSQDVVFAVSAVADIADDTAVSVTEDTPTVIAVLANDSFEGSPVVTATTAPANGAVVINGDNTITYTPNANYTGADSFTYTVTSGGVTETATVTVNVTADNDAPTIEAAIADQNLAEDFASYTIDLNAAFADVETTDANLVYGVSGNTNINVSITAGIATITPTADWNGSETLTFSATDQGALSVSQDVVFAVSAVADIADDTAVSVTEDTPTVIAVLANDSFEGSPVVTATTAPANGALVINGDNTITYTPNANYTGADSFTYTVTSGGVTETATVTVNVTADNDAPTIEAAIADQNLAEDFASYTIDLNAAFADVETTDANLVYGVSGNTNINVSITAGIATITPTADWNGSETLTFSATDQGALSVSQDVVFAVSAVADIADDTAVSVTEDTPTVIAVLANDSFEGSPVVTATTAPANGALVINGDNTITYTPNANYTGADSFTYTVTSGGVTETATVTVNVTADNDAPTIEAAIADQNLAEDFASYTIDLNAAFADVETTDANLVYGVSGNTNINVSITGGIATITPTADWNGSETLTFSATDQGALSVSQDVVFAVSAVADIADDTAVSVTEDTPTVIAVLANDSFEGSPVVTATTAPANGALVINGDNTITYTPNANYTGADSFTYTVTSGGVTETATVTVNVTADNDAPTIEAAIADQNLAEDFASYTIDLNAAFADVETTDANLVYGVSGNTNINVSITAGIATITPTADWNGSETLSFSATDQGALSVSQDVVFAVSAVADIADDTAVSVTEDTPTVIAVLANDSFEGSPVVTATTAPANGALVINGDNTITYTPNANYTGADSFTYTVTSGGVTETATVTVNVTADNDAPTTTPVTLTAINEDGGTRLITQAELLANAADVDGPALTATNLAISTGSGTLVDNGDGTWNYTPAANDDTSVSFTNTITDGSLTAAGSATLDITPVNDAPVTNNDSATVDEGRNVVINLVGNDADVENALDLNSITITAAPANGSLVDNGDGTLTYTHDGSKTISDSFSYTINDVSGATSNIAAVSLTVNPANDNDPADSTDPNPILEDLVKDEDEDSDAGDPTYEAPGEDPLTEDEPLLLVEEYQAPEDSGDADESIVQIKDSQDEETQDIILLTDEIDRNTQSEERDDDRGYTYYDNDLYKDISFSKYLNFNGFNAENEPVAVSLDDVSFLDFDSEDNDPVIIDEDYDALRQEIDESFNTELEGQAIKAKIVTATAATFTVGLVSYLLRAGSLVASMMSALPLWRGFDPIAIFSGDKKKKKKKNEISDAGELKPEAFFDGDAE